MTENGFIQIGVTSARAPDGTFLPAQPIYIQRTPEAEIIETAALQPVTKIFAAKFTQYVRETEKIEAEANKRRDAHETESRRRNSEQSEADDSSR